MWVVCQDYPNGWLNNVCGERGGLCPCSACREAGLWGLHGAMRGIPIMR